MSDAPPRRVLVIFPGALGDFICFLPALHTLGEDACVDLLARSEFADLAPAAVNVASLERYEIRRLFVAGAQDEERVRDFFAAYAAVYSWMGSQASEFVRQLELVSQGGARLFAFRPRDQKMPQRDYYLNCLDPSTRASAVAGGRSLGISPENRGVVLSERSESKDNGGAAPGLPGGRTSRRAPAPPFLSSTARKWRDCRRLGDRRLDRRSLQRHGDSSRRSVEARRPGLQHARGLRLGAGSTAAG